jgi:hypothetical protein
MSKSHSRERTRRIFLVFLAVVGFLFFLQATLQVDQFLAELHKPTGVDPVRFRIYVGELSVGHMVGGVVGSLFGCFGSWLLLIYLKLNRIERQIAELRSCHTELDSSEVVESHVKRPRWQIGVVLLCAILGGGGIAASMCHLMVTVVSLALGKIHMGVGHSTMVADMIGVLAGSSIVVTAVSLHKGRWRYATVSVLVGASLAVLAFLYRL